jgi:serine phosphatase RsbU (regulator of sigma subunit)
MGHGVRSALVTAIVRALVEELTSVASDPGQMLSQLNRDIRTILRQSGTPLFTTAFYMVVDLEKREICYANAGHPKPMLVHRATRTVELLGNKDGKSCPALGLFDKAVYTTTCTSMLEGDLAMLFTDGIYDVDSNDCDAFSPEWLLGEVQKRVDFSASALFDEILAEIRKASGGEFADDICLVGMEVASL